MKSVWSTVKGYCIKHNQEGGRIIFKLWGMGEMMTFNLTYGGVIPYLNTYIGGPGGVMKI